MSDRLAFISLCAYGYFDTDAPVTGGGAERQIYLLAHELTGDFDVHLVVGDYGQPKRRTVDDITIHRAYRPGETTGFAGKVGDFRRLFRAMRAADADVFVFRGDPRKAVVTFWLAKLLGADWVYNFANDNAFSAVQSTVERHLFATALRNASGVIAQTDHQRELLSDRVGVAATVVPNGYPPAEEDIPPTDRSYFLWVGRLNEAQKHPEWFLELASRIPDEEFVIVGPRRDDDYYARLRRQIEALDNVRYEGAVDPDEIHTYYRRAKALVNTSAYEGFPNTFLEAWRTRTPVLSLHVDPGRYVDGSIPRCYADGSMDSLSAAVEALATDETAWEAAVTAPYEYFRRHLTIEQVAQDYGEAIDSRAVERR